MKEDEEIIQIFKDYIKQYEKSNTLSVAILPNGENVIYTKIKMTGMQKEFMKDYIERKENNNGRRNSRRTRKNIHNTN